jgi:hypothetical protein
LVHEKGSGGEVFVESVGGEFGGWEEALGVSIDGWSFATVGAIGRGRWGGGWLAFGDEGVGVESGFVEVVIGDVCACNGVKDDLTSRAVHLFNFFQKFSCCQSTVILISHGHETY